jgi:hypothetical protein
MAARTGQRFLARTPARSSPGSCLFGGVDSERAAHIQKWPRLRQVRAVPTIPSKQRRVRRRCSESANEGAEEPVFRFTLASSLGRSPHEATESKADDRHRDAQAEAPEALPDVPVCEVHNGGKGGVRAERTGGERHGQTVHCGTQRRMRNARVRQGCGTEKQDPDGRAVHAQGLPAIPNLMELRAAKGLLLGLGRRVQR